MPFLILLKDGSWLCFWAASVCQEHGKIGKQSDLVRTPWLPLHNVDPNWSNQDYFKSVLVSIPSHIHNWICRYIIHTLCRFVLVSLARSTLHIWVRGHFQKLCLCYFSNRGWFYWILSYYLLGVFNYFQKNHLIVTIFYYKKYMSSNYFYELHHSLFHSYH